MKYLLFIVVVASVILVYSPTGSLFKNQYDDAYITYRCARNLATGNGLFFNRDDKVESTSSLFYALAIAGFYRVGVHNIEFLAGLLNLIALGMIAVLFYDLLLFFDKRSRILASIWAYLVVIHGFMSGWTAMGMETIVFTFFVVLFFWLVMKDDYPPAYSILALIAIIGLRPEGCLLIPVWWVIVCFERRRYPHWVKYALIPFVAFVLLCLFRFAYFGTLLPHTMLAKSLIAYYAPNPRGIFAHWLFFAAFPVVLLIVYLANALEHIIIDTAFLVYAAVSVLLSAFFMFGDYIRYSVHVFPLVMFYAYIGLKSTRLRVVRYALLVLVVAQTSISIIDFRSFAALASLHSTARRAVGESLVEKSNPLVGNSINWILSSDLGMIGYVAEDFQFIDITGLTSGEVYRCYRQHKNLDSLLFALLPILIADTFHQLDSTTSVYTKLSYREWIRESLPPTLFDKSITIQPLFVKVVVNGGRRMRGFGINSIKYKKEMK